MYNNVIISLDNLSDTGLKEIKKFSLLNENCILEKFRHVDNNNYDLQETVVLETFMLIKYLLNKGYTLSQIKLFVNSPLFIYNDSLYYINNLGKIEIVNLDKLLFLSVRGVNWNYPIFHILEKLLKKHKGKLSKTNLLNYNIPFKGKFYALKDLYLSRSNLIGDILIPFKIYSEYYDVLISFIKDKFGDRIILKKDNTQAGEGVYPCDLSTADGVKKFKNIMKTHKEYLKEIYITPYYDFKEEYRVYFTKFNNQIKIYSLKKKKILNKKDELIKKDSFLLWKNVFVKWFYIENKEWQYRVGSYYFVYEKAMEYISYLNYNAGSLEFGLTNDGKYILLEVNSMSDPVCFSKYNNEDIQNIRKYYEDIFSFLTS